MSRNLKSIIEEIAESEEMSKEFSAINEINEIYEYCKNMGLDSSEEEFDEEVSSMIDNFDMYLSQIDQNDLGLVAGGINLNKKFNKVLASALSALMLTGAGAVNSNLAAGMDTHSKSASTSFSANKKIANKKYIIKSDANTKSDSQFSKTVESIKEFFRKHKLGTGITVAVILMLTYAGFSYRNGDIRFWKWGHKVHHRPQRKKHSNEPLVREEELEQKQRNEQKDRLKQEMIQHGWEPPTLNKDSSEVVEEESTDFIIFYHTLSDEDKRLADEIIAEADIACAFTALPEFVEEEQSSTVPHSSTSSSGKDELFSDETTSSREELTVAFNEHLPRVCVD